ncbi:MAG: FAD-binding protein [Acetobacteraceae bacterium]
MVRPIVAVPVDDRDGSRAFGVIAAAAGLPSAEPPHAVLVGRAPSSTDVAEAFRHGAGEVTVLAHAAAAIPADPDQVVAMLAALSGAEARWLEGGTIFVLPSGLIGEEVAARLAARFDGVALGLCQTLVSDGPAGQRSAFGGRAELVIGGEGRPCFAALHGAEPPAGTPPSGPVRHVDLAIALPSTDHLRSIPSASREARLDGARIVVSGGRGMGGEEGFAQLRDLAEQLGGALAAACRRSTPGGCRSPADRPIRAVRGAGYLCGRGDFWNAATSGRYQCSQPHRGHQPRPGGRYLPPCDGRHRSPTGSCCCRLSWRGCVERALVPTGFDVDSVARMARAVPASNGQHQGRF